jgi:putative glycosyltransferase (TIGR04372 family)
MLKGFLFMGRFVPDSEKNSCVIIRDGQHSSRYSKCPVERIDMITLKDEGLAALRRRSWRLIATILMLLSFPLQVMGMILIRILKPWILVRIGWINSTRIGHMAGNTELRLCTIESGIKRPNRRHFDLWCCTQEHVCNMQLLKMWKRCFPILPRWALTITAHLNLKFPGGTEHHIDEHSDRDIHNLLDSTSTHLCFSHNEVKRGEHTLLKFGVKAGSKIVCLIVRDDAYLNNSYKSNDWSYHNFRNSDIQNYVLAAETLADRGYYVFRMGAQVLAPINSKHPRVIDYATNGMRSDFMDIYLGAKCEFCISTSTGFDAVPLIFRRPIVYTNMVPIGWLFTFSKRFLAITKHHFSVEEHRELTLGEIFDRGVGYCASSAEYESKGIRLIENTPEEIRDVVLEMADRLEGNWVPNEEGEALQARFWQIFPKDGIDVKGVPLHGEIRSRFGEKFLCNYPWWLYIESKNSNQSRW